MLFAICSFLVSGVFGTVASLRLLEIERKTVGHNYTIRGRLVIGLFWGLVVGILVVFIDGVWWNCDTGICHATWGY